jgi:hypothetical protein
MITDEALALSECITLLVHSDRKLRGKVVWQKGAAYGIEFLERLADADDILFEATCSKIFDNKQIEFVNR